MKTDAMIAAPSFQVMTAIASSFQANEQLQRITAVRSGTRLILGLLGAGFVALGTATAQPAELPAGPNRDVVARECGACHDLEMVVAAAGASRQAWSDTIDEMISYGARIDPQDRPRILDYLSSFLGPIAPKPPAR
jgi:hypothetical protein